MLLNASHPAIAKAREIGISGDVYLVACGQEKRSTPAEARDLYTGDLTAKQIAFVQRRTDGLGNQAAWAILSARHGILDGGKVTCPYDESLSRMSAAERRAWGRMVAAELVDRGLTGCIFHVLAGASYLEPLRAAIAEAGIGRVVEFYCSAPMQTVKPQIGQRKAQMKRQADYEASWDAEAAAAVDRFYFDAA